METLASSIEVINNHGGAPHDWLHVWFLFWGFTCLVFLEVWPILLIRTVGQELLTLCQFSLAPQCCHTTEMKVFFYHSVAVTVKLVFLLAQDFESVSSDCTDAVRGAFHQLKELAQSQGKYLWSGSSWWKDGFNLNSYLNIQWCSVAIAGHRTNVCFFFFLPSMSRTSDKEYVVLLVVRKSWNKK